MNVLIVLAHPETRSFNGAMHDTARRVLREAGHEVRESDLYAMRWQPVLGHEDFAVHPPGAFFNAQDAQRLFGPIKWVLHPLRVGTFNFCGFDTLVPFVAWAAGHVGDEGRQRYLQQWQQRLDAIEHEAPQPFRHLADFPSPAMRDHR